MSLSLSVIMPVFNGERYVAQALDRVCSQMRDGIEVVVVDNGSFDRTSEIVNGYTNLLPVRVINPGRTGSWLIASNIGLKEATRDWACFLHHDDLWLPGRVSQVEAALENFDGSLVINNSIFVGPDGEKLGRWTCPLPAGDVTSEFFLERLLTQNFIAMLSPVFRRRAAIELGGLDLSLWFAADWDLWLRLGATGSVRFIEETLTAYRVHPTSQTAARKIAPSEWRDQLKTVFDRNAKNCHIVGMRRRRLERTAMASIAVNSALALASRGEPCHPFATVVELSKLSPLGWHKYLRDSRIIERVSSRVRVGMSSSLRS